MEKIMELTVNGWRRLSIAMLIGTFGYGGFVATDIALHADHGDHSGSGFSGAANAEAPRGLKTGLGRAATEDEIKAWDIDIRPDGLGLPEGRGDVAAGEEAFAEKCASCHGDFGEGAGRWPVLAGGKGTLASEDPVKTVGSYWPYLSTVWDYVHRAMPFGDAQSLTDDEVYAITAYILYANDLVDDDFELSHENFKDVRLPNEANFFPDDREKSPLFGPRDVCMKDCKDDVKVTMRARVLDVTPDSGDSGADTSGGKSEKKPEKKAEAGAGDAADDPTLVADGAKVFKKKCKSCHKIGDGAKNSTGPMLTGIFGAPVGQVDGFKYSKVFKNKSEEGLRWDAASLSAFLKKPSDWAPKTRMRFAGLKKEEDRKAIIAYLKSVGK